MWEMYNSRLLFFFVFMQNHIGWKANYDTVIANKGWVNCALEENLVQLKLLHINTIKYGSSKTLRHC